MVEDKIILGIDPGTTVLGYGIIHIQNGKLSMLNFGIIQLSLFITGGKSNYSSDGQNN